MILFHITPRKNLPSILIRGLGKVQGEGFLSRADSRILNQGYGFIPVWLTDDPYFLIQNQLTEDWVDKNEPVIFAVKTTNVFETFERKNYVEYIVRSLDIQNIRCLGKLW